MPVVRSSCCSTVYFVFCFIVVLSSVQLSWCESSVVYSRVGETVQLSFQYPCNSTRVTLQRDHRPPFYSSRPEEQLTRLHHNQQVTAKISPTQVNNCSLQLHFDPVSRIDAATYVFYSQEHLTKTR